MKKQTEAQVADVFSRHDVVAYYDRLAELSGLTSAEQSLLHTYITSFERLLVAGCGTGREIFALSKRGKMLIGVDIAWNMVHKANQKRRLLQKENVKFQQGSIVHLPYRDESFEHALMFAEVIQHIPKRWCRQQALQEVFRVVKPGGYVFLSAFNQPISVLYLLLLMENIHQRVFAEQDYMPNVSHTQTQPSRVPGLSGKNHWWRKFVQRIVRRIIWEFHPTIWSYADLLPVTYRIGFTCACAFMNIQRTLCSRLMPEAENLLEPNDFLIDHPYIRFRLLPTGGNLFVHFPDIEEMLEDLRAAGFNLVEYRSLEELQQGQVLSEKERRSKRLIFYVVQKPG